MSPRVKYTGFKMPEPAFSGKATDLIMDMEFLRRREIVMTTDPILFEQLRRIFGELDALGSARIDGNKTGLTKFLESREEDPDTKGRKTVEIERVTEALSDIHENYPDILFNQGYLKNLHKQIRKDITKESNRHAGIYRRCDARPALAASHASSIQMVESYMDKLMAFLNKSYSYKYDAVKTVYAHQKFLWVHPFYEANGIIARLLTTLMLKKQGFAGTYGRIINASLGIGVDPQKYHNLIRKADSGIDKDHNNWIEYSIEGIRDSMFQMDKLSDYNYLKEEVLIPAFKHPLFDRIFTDHDRLIVEIAIEKQVFQAADIRIYFPGKHPSEISKMLKWLKEKEMLINLEENSRKYALNLENKYLVKVLVSKFDRLGFLPFDK